MRCCNVLNALAAILLEALNYPHQSGKSCIFFIERLNHGRTLYYTASQVLDFVALKVYILLLGIRPTQDANI